MIPPRLDHAQGRHDLGGRGLPGEDCAHRVVRDIAALRNLSRSAWVVHNHDHHEPTPNIGNHPKSKYKHIC
jgi:hypothetical protein